MQLKELDAQKFKLEMQPDQEDADMRSHSVCSDLAGSKRDQHGGERGQPVPGSDPELKVSAGTNAGGQAIIPTRCAKS
jgi:hypothetical protein